MSDEARPSHYRYRHTMNKGWCNRSVSLSKSRLIILVGSLLAGEIVADMTFLRDEKRIEKLPTAPLPGARRGAKQEYHWAVEFDLVMIIDGRNLRYEARWPPVDKPAQEDAEDQQIDADNQLADADSKQADANNQQVCAAGQVCIAAAFKPGTA
jgi:hypothetical protein